MTTETSIANLLERRGNLEETAKSAWAAMREIEYQIIATLRERYPEEWKAWESGKRKFQAEGVSVDLKREYDPDKVKAEFGEEFPDAVELVEPLPYYKANGRKLASLWKDAAYAKRLERCLLPPAAPKLKVSE